MEYRHSTNSEKGNPAISTVIQSRVPIFQPLTRWAPGKEKPTIIRVETSWGCVQLGKMGEDPVILTQEHRDLLDVLMAESIKIFDYPTGERAVICDPYQVCKSLKLKKNNGVFLRTKMDDLRKVYLTIEDKKSGWTIHSGIVSEWGWSEKLTRENPRKWRFPAVFPDQTKKGGALVKVLFSSSWMKIWREDMEIHYRPILGIVLDLSAPSRALARFCLTHKGGYHDTLDSTLRILNAIRADMTARAIRKVKGEVRKDRELLATIGILIDGEKVDSVRDGRVYFESPEAKGAIPGT